ncbi:MAG: hypothetical protein LUE97_06495 [Oscillospiraceae bacterium]|nr:hypothetical protein [Oscillospiraceae bacterium]
MEKLKKYVYESDIQRREKPLEYKYMFAKTCAVTVYAENEEQALELAKGAIRTRLYQSGILPVGEPRFVHVDDLPRDWSYGYDDERVTGFDIDDQTRIKSGKDVFVLN